MEPEECKKILHGYSQLVRLLPIQVKAKKYKWARAYQHGIKVLYKRILAQMQRAEVVVEKGKRGVWRTVEKEECTNCGAKIIWGTDNENR